MYSNFLVTYNNNKTIIVDAFSKAQAIDIVKAFVPRVLKINNVQNLSVKK